MLRATLLGAFALLLSAGAVSAQNAATADPELAPLERLVGGEWHLGTDIYHTFAWGVGGRSVTSKSYVSSPEGETLVSESTFFFHPGDGVVKGYAVAIGMGIDLFEYDVSFEGDTIVLDLRAFGSAAPDGPMRETWTFTDGDHYEWTLLDGTGGEWERQMGGTFERMR